MGYNFKLKINEYLSKCDLKDVISFNGKHGKQWSDIQTLKLIIKEAFSNAGISSIKQRMFERKQFQQIITWFDNGEECEILRAGSQGWQKGKLKINITLEFIPDETEAETSPLDDIRQATSNDLEQK